MVRYIVNLHHAVAIPISTLTHMAHFVIADITDAKSVLQDIQSIVPNNPSVPAQPIPLASQEEPGMFDFLCQFPWLLKVFLYDNLEGLLGALEEMVIGPAELKRRQSSENRKHPSNKERCQSLPFAKLHYAMTDTFRDG